MRKLSNPIHLLANGIQWLFTIAAIATLSGSASAIFLYTLDWAIATRQTYGGLIWFLPIGGFFIAWLYLKIGRGLESGNNLLIDEIHNPQKIIPLRMAPLVFLGTVSSHLFGASVGREGTAVQMAGALADQFTHGRLPEQRRIILMVGIAAGFSSVFGTPLAGTVFALEVLAIGKLRFEGLLPCLIAAVIAHFVTLFWGIQHIHYPPVDIPSISIKLAAAVLVAGIAFGITAKVFCLITHSSCRWVVRQLPYPPLRSLIGGLLILLAVWLFNAYHYTSLGIPTIIAAFQNVLPSYDFAVKMLFTTASLASGFKGGEVTPLFYIGTTLGNALAPLLQLPISLLAAIGFVAVFAGAANTPLACTLMAIELFGVEIAYLAGLACAMSYCFSGKKGIYHAQRMRHNKIQI